ELFLARDPGDLLNRGAGFGGGLFIEGAAAVVNVLHLADDFSVSRADHAEIAVDPLADDTGRTGRFDLCVALRECIGGRNATEHQNKAEDQSTKNGHVCLPRGPGYQNRSGLSAISSDTSRSSLMRTSCVMLTLRSI